MAEIDIDGLSEDELVALNERIVERLMLLHRQRTSAALQEIRVGSWVVFEGPDGELVTGIVIRRNRKTVTVHSKDDRRWNVSPQLLKLTDDDLSALVDREMPFLKLNDADYAAYINANVPGFGKK